MMSTDRPLHSFTQIVALATLLQLVSCAHHDDAAIPAPCSPAWKIMVDHRLGISDEFNHGPDIGSAEWMQAVSHKAHVVDKFGHGPSPGSDEWCRAVDYKVFRRR